MLPSLKGTSITYGKNDFLTHAQILLIYFERIVSPVTLLFYGRFYWSKVYDFFTHEGNLFKVGLLEVGLNQCKVQVESKSMKFLVSIVQTVQQEVKKWHVYSTFFLPVGISVNIWSIPRYAVKTKMSLRSVHNEVYFCNIILQATLPSSSTSSKYLLPLRSPIIILWYHRFCQNRFKFLQFVIDRKQHTDRTEWKSSFHQCRRTKDTKKTEQNESHLSTNVEGQKIQKHSVRTDNETAGYVIRFVMISLWNDEKYYE